MAEMYFILMMTFFFHALYLTQSPSGNHHNIYLKKKYNCFFSVKHAKRWKHR